MGASASLIGAATAGPDWEEGALSSGDAGRFPSNAQVPFGKPPLSDMDSLSGNLVSTLAGDDPEDMYLIYIEFPALFTASVNTPPTVAAGEFEAQLWLFDLNGVGILGNDGAGDFASLGPSATDGSGSTITSAGAYYLAISAVNSDPVDVADSLLFDQAVAGEVSGPDGSGGSNPIDDWTGATMGGAYSITLTGCAFVPCYGDTNLDGFVDVDDLVKLILDWGTTNPDSDIDGSGTVDVDDLVDLLLQWGKCELGP